MIRDVQGNPSLDAGLLDCGGNPAAAGATPLWLGGARPERGVAAGALPPHSKTVSFVYPALSGGHS